MACGKIHLPRLALHHLDGIPDFRFRGARSPAGFPRPDRHRARDAGHSAGRDGQTFAGGTGKISRTDTGTIQGDGQGHAQIFDGRESRGAKRHSRIVPQQPRRAHQHDRMALPAPAAPVGRLPETGIHLAARRPDQKIQHHPAVRRHTENHVDRPAVCRAAGGGRGDLRFAARASARP